MNYYKTIEGKRIDSRLLDIARQATEGNRDGRISQQDAERLFEAVKDGNVYTETEKNTIGYIRSHFHWTENADRWFRNSISRWRTPIGRLHMTPAEIAKEHFPIHDVLHDENERKIRRHDLNTAVAETQLDHDDIGLIVQLASGESVEVMCNFIEMGEDFVELKGGHIIPVRAIEKVEI